MFYSDDDIVERNHCVDDDTCPVNEDVKDEYFLRLSEIEKRESDELQKMQVAAIDTYHQVLEETGCIKKAEEAFFKIHSDYYGRN